MAADARSTVRALLSAADIAPPEPEVEAMTGAYPALRAAADGLYSEEISRFEPVFFPTEVEVAER